VSVSTRDQSKAVPSPRDEAEPGVDRRKFLTFLVSAPVLTVAAKLGIDSAAGTATR
jgi:hypothetical protein